MRIQPFAVATALITIVLSSGCAGIYRVALTPDAAEQLRTASTIGIVAIEKDEIGTSIGASQIGAMTGGGLIGAIADSIIDSKNAKDAEANAAEIRNSLLEYSFDQAVSNAFTNRFAQSGTHLALTTVVVSKNTAASEIERLVRDASGDAVAVAFVRHLMSPNFTQVVIVTDVVVCAKSDALKKIAIEKSYGDAKVPVLYCNKVQTFWQLPDGSKPAKVNNKDLTTAWSQNAGVALRTALDMACSEIVEIIHWDLSQPGQEDYYESATGQVVTSFDYTKKSPMGVRAKVFKHENKRVWSRAADGCIYAQVE